MYVPFLFLFCHMDRQCECFLCPCIIRPSSHNGIRVVENYKQILVVKFSPKTSTKGVLSVQLPVRS